MSFTTTDCWVLFSIGFSKRGSTLKNIIRTGDYLNRAILTREELETSLNKLLHNNYIDVSEDRFFVTDKALAFYSQYKKTSEGCIIEWLRLSEILKHQPAKPDEIHIINLTKEEYKKALNEYKTGL